MLRRADVAVYSPDGKLQLAVEVKNRPGASRDWVIQMHRNLLVHTAIPNAPYFLLALPDFCYLWKDSAPINDRIAPDYTIETATLLRPYYRESMQLLNDISEYGLELLVTSWLEDLVSSELTRETASPNLQWLFDSGLYDAIKGGLVVVEATV